MPGRFWRGNLHTHSTLSDGRLSPENAVKAYKTAGYDFLMLSEHFVSHYDWPVADTTSMRPDGFTTLIGAELHALSTSVGELWHIVAAGLPLDFPPCGENESGPEIARRARTAGAFVGIAHPSWSQLSIEDGYAIDSAHGVEIYNHGCAVETTRGDGFYLLDRMLNDGRRLGGFATDDAHFANHDTDAFGGWVQVRAEKNEPELLLDALKQGHYYSSQGPQIHHLAIADNRLAIECSPVDSIAVLGGTSRSAREHGRAITSALVDLAQLELSWEEVEPSKWLRVVIIDAFGKHAWSNPIWLDELEE